MQVKARLIFRSLPFLAGALFWLMALADPHSRAFAQGAPAQPPAAATQAADAADDPLGNVRQSIVKADRQLKSLSDMVKAASTDDARLVDLKARVDDLGRGVLKTSVGLRPRLEEISKRLTELGDPPKEGQPPEAPDVTEERNRLTEERGRINAITGDAENLSVATGALANRITEIRRQLFTETLTRRSMLSYDMLAEASAALVDEVGDFQRTTSSWMNFVWRTKKMQLLTAVGLSIGAALVFLSGGYRMLGFLIRRNADDPDPPYIGRLSVAFWSTLISVMALSCFLATSYFFMDTFNIFRPDIAPMVSAALSVVGIVYFVWRLAHASSRPSTRAGGSCAFRTAVRDGW